MAGADLRTTHGGVVRVRYPGISREGAGPDFKDAVLENEQGGLLQGDVEVHVHASDCHGHGHAADPAYDNVLLHVVGNAGRSSTTHTSSGREVPVAVMEGSCGPGSGGLPCAGCYARDPGRVIAVLRSAGHERLVTRAGSIAVQVRRDGCLETFGSLVARALGYSANAGPLQMLGEYVCRSDIKEELCGRAARTRRKQMLGLAGLLPRQRLAAGRSEWSPPGGPPEDSSVPLVLSGAWRFHGVYPNNSPVRRVVALADMLPSLGDIAAALLDSSARGGCGGGDVARLFLVRGDGYWRTHYDFGCRTAQSDLVGPSKAATIVVDAVLPWLYAVALVGSDGTLLRKVVEHYAACASPRPNAVSRHMVSQLGLARSRTALTTQGLHHLFAAYCTRGLCVVCPLGNPDAQPRGS